MSDVTKINRSMPRGNRYQIFDSSDTNDDGGAVAQGDIIRVTDSLQSPARKAVLVTSAGCDLGITINSRQTVYPRLSSMNYASPMLSHYERSVSVLASGVEVSTDNPEIDVTPGVTQEFTGPIDDIEITTWSAGTWEFRVE